MMKECRERHVEEREIVDSRSVNFSILGQHVSIMVVDSIFTTLNVDDDTNIFSLLALLRASLMDLISDGHLPFIVIVEAIFCTSHQLLALS